MGASSPEEEFRAELNTVSDVFEMKKIPNDQYSCPECAAVPEIVQLYCETNEIELNCREHGKRRMFIKDYFKRELKHLYNKSICSVCLKSQDTVSDFFKFCYDCKKIFCNQCIKNHYHKSYVNVNEINDRCARHFDQQNKFYCKKCDANVCLEDDDSKHKLKVIKDFRPDPADIQKIKKRNEFYKKEKKLLDCLIKLTETVLNTYKKSPHNYWHCLNVTRIAQSIEGRKDSEEKKLNSLNIEYKVESSTNKLRLFGSEFVKNNKGKCAITLNNVAGEQELCEFYPNSVNGNVKVKLIERESLTNLSYMFDDCTLLSSVPDFDKWDMIGVTNLSHMFNNCKSLEYLPNIGKWDVSEVTDISYFLSGCTKLTSLPGDISDWRTGSFSFMNNLFYNCTGLISLPDISKWDTSYVTYMSSMFEGCTDLEQMPDISRWKTKNVVDMNSMFKECYSLPSLPNFSKWDTSNCINMKSLFLNCSNIREIPNVSRWDVSKVVDLSHMFDGCSKATKVPDISGWITYSCENMNGLFNKCSKIIELPDISGWITRKVKDMACMFCSCAALKSLPDISKWTTDLVVDMSHMFDGLKLITTIPDISVWNTSNVNNMGGMFYYCEKLETIPNLKKWDTSSLSYTTGMFDGCAALDKDIIPAKFS